jgi:hypothetical protein
METIDYDELTSKIMSGNRNILVLGAAGTGKSQLIKRLEEKYREAGFDGHILLTAPTGIAGQNIGGVTIQSLFNIKPYSYNITNVNINMTHNQEKIKNAGILLVDEISMLRHEILDITDAKLRVIRNSNSPFGGLRLLFLGDLFQMEPVVQNFEHESLQKIYPHLREGDCYFFNSDAMRNNDYFDRTFDIFRLDHIFRQTNGDFIKILDELRHGKISEVSLKALNSRVRPAGFYNKSYQYLTVSNRMATEINKKFIGELSGECYYSEPEYEWDNDIFGNIVTGDKCPVNQNIPIKKGMKIIFVMNDRRAFSERRYVNGTIGEILGFDLDKGTVIVKSGNNVIVAGKEKYSVFARTRYGIPEVGSVINFPFIPAYAITIDKSQGLTLDKIYVVLGRNPVRNNQIYVALSRARSLNDIVIDRVITANDIRVSEPMRSFCDYIEPRITPVVYKTADTRPNITISHCNNTTVNINHI